MSTLGGSIIEQRAHVRCGGAVSLADPVHVSIRDREAAVTHPLPYRPSLCNDAELGRHEVSQPIQRVAVPSRCIRAVNRLLTVRAKYGL
jgi:hypothetical protein